MSGGKRTSHPCVVSKWGATSFTDYYPFGFAMPGRQYLTGSPYRFGYQGQFAEKDEETGLNHFEARAYDSRIGRWLTTDPADHDWSPYLGMGNNWPGAVDPDGRFFGKLRANISVFFKGGKVEYMNLTGNYIAVYNDGSTRNFGQSGFRGTGELKLGTFVIPEELSFMGIDTYGEIEAPLFTSDILSSTFSGIAISGSFLATEKSTFRLIKNGEFDFKLYHSGWNKGNQYVKSSNIYRISSLGKLSDIGGGIITTSYAYSEIASGNLSPINYMDASVGTIGIMNSAATYYAGAAVPYVAPFVVLYGTCRMVWDVSFHFGYHYGPIGAIKGTNSWHK